LSSTTAIPYLDLSRARRAIEPELFERWRSIAEANAFILGPEVKQLEAGFAAFLGAAAVVAVGNGTDALVVALRALGLEPGDEVLVPAFSFFATAEAVVWAGGRPVFCDIDPETFNLDPAELERRATPRTRGVVGVHLYGRALDADAVSEVCRARGWWWLEDAAQAHGARYRGRRVGTLGDLAAWSFYPTKNLGAFGDGGAVSGMDRDRMQRVFRVANHGQTSRYHHVEIGTNSRLDSLQAAVLNLRLARLDADNAQRRKLAAIYHEGLAGVGDLRFPRDRPEDEPVFHQMTIATARRDELQKFLAERGVGSSVHYPSPLHRQPALAALLPDPPELPHAERAAREVLCLPMFAELEPDEARGAVEAVRAFYGA
jgi:dTDP-3-amino-3,4,6-trideoxy-alpha-D-glucose transaminase